MFIARKKRKHEENEITKFIMLIEKPHTSIDAIALANEISKDADSYSKAGKGSSFARSIARNELKDNVDNWGRFVFLPELEMLDQIEHLLKGKIKISNTECNIPMTKFNNLISSIGPDRKRFGDTFKILTENVPGAIPIIKGGEELQRLRMATRPNAYALQLNQNARAMFAKKGGWFFVPNRIRVTTAHATALVSSEKTIANIFYCVRLKEESVNKIKALCLWLNTTWGVLTIMANRMDTHGGFIELNMSHWRMLPVLDIDKLNERQIELLSDVYNRFQDRNLRRIPDQYRTNNGLDTVRYDLDKAFLSVFEIEVDNSDLLQLYQPFSQALDQWLGQ